MMLPGWKMVEVFTSRRLALQIFLGICAFGVYGSVVPPRDAERVFTRTFGEFGLAAARLVGLLDTYRSPLFRALLAALVLNILVCTLMRISPRLGPRGSRWRQRGGAVPLLDLLLHLSVVVMLAGGAAKAIWGMTTTKNVHVGRTTDTAFDWRREAEVPLGFTVLAKERVDVYFPARVQVGVRWANTGAKVGLVELREGESPVAVHGTSAALALLSLERKSGHIFLLIDVEGRQERVEFETRRGGKTVEAAGPFTLTLVAFRDILKTVRSLIVIAEGDQVVLEQWLEPNGSVEHRGMSIFQTAWGTDEFDNPYVGLQFVRDPGAPVFWAGCVALALLVPVYLTLRHGRRRGVTAPAAPDH